MFHIEIYIKGKLDPTWSDWFENMRILPNECGNTVLTGNLPDQPALYGVLSRLSSLGRTLISVSCREEADKDPPQS